MSFVLNRILRIEVLTINKLFWCTQLSCFVALTYIIIALKPNHLYFKFSQHYCFMQKQVGFFAVHTHTRTHIITLSHQANYMPLCSPSEVIQPHGLLGNKLFSSSVESLLSLWENHMVNSTTVASPKKLFTGIIKSTRPHAHPVKVSSKDHWLGFC